LVTCGTVAILLAATGCSRSADPAPTHHQTYGYMADVPPSPWRVGDTINVNWIRQDLGNIVTVAPHPLTFQVAVYGPFRNIDDLKTEISGFPSNWPRGVFRTPTISSDSWSGKQLPPSVLRLPTDLIPGLYCVVALSTDNGGWGSNLFYITVVADPN
jgi:hypothetical protein